MPKRQKAATAKTAQQRPESRADREENADDDEHPAPERRFAWLLAPIRDLAQNWNIDIATALEDYLDELGHIRISVDPNEQNQRMNFAEAALLLQGSTAVYSKKVDYLYELCNNLVHVLNQRAREHQGEDGNGDGNQGAGPEADPVIRRARDFDDEFLPLDDLQECKDIDLKENDSDEASILAARARLIRPPMPLSLVPLEDFEKSQTPLISASGKILGRRDDFWMNTAKIHPGTGALLLDACNAALITVSASANTFVHCARDRAFGGLNINPMSPGHDGDPQMQISPGTPKTSNQRAQGPPEEPPPAVDTVCPDGDDDDGGGFDNFDHDVTVTNFDPVTEAAATVANPPPPVQNVERAVRFGLLAAPTKGRKRKTQREVMNEILGDPWKDLSLSADEDESSDPSNLHAKKIKKIRKCKVPNLGVPDAAAADAMGTVQLPDKPVSDYLNEFVYSRPRRMPRESWKKPSCHAVVDVFWSERKARVKAQKARMKAQADGVPIAPPSQSKRRRQSAIDREQEERRAKLSTELHLIFDNEPICDVVGNYDDDDDNDAGGEYVDLPDNDDDVVIPGFDALPADADHPPSFEPVTYEDLVKIRLEQILSEAQKNIVLGDISRRVQEWETKITPVLLEDESRRGFDIHEYGGDLLKFFDDEDGDSDDDGDSDSNGDTSSYDFSDFAKTQPQWEVCRYFLSSLMLANTGNVELKTSGEEGTLESINTLNLTLLSKERHHEQLEEFAAPSARDH